MRLMIDYRVMLQGSSVHFFNLKCFRLNILYFFFRMKVRSFPDTFWNIQTCLLSIKLHEIPGLLEAM